MGDHHHYPVYLRKAVHPMLYRLLRKTLLKTRHRLVLVILNWVRMVEAVLLRNNTNSRKIPRHRLTSDSSERKAAPMDWDKQEVAATSAEAGVRARSRIGLTQ